jgi:ATP-dependent DNA helicase PIF1
VYQTRIFKYNEQKREALRKLSVIIIDEVLIVEAKLLDFVLSIFRRLKGNNLPFGGVHVIAFGDLMQLPPIEGQKVWKAEVWPLFYPVFLTEPQSQRGRFFFKVLNKIRFGTVDDQVRKLLTEC